MQAPKQVSEDVFTKNDPVNLVGCIDLNKPGMPALLAERIRADIDSYCVAAYSDGHRTHLGASLIGKECDRELWYSFRWAGAPDFDGRMYRLFNRGHREEERFVEWLNGIGFKVEEVSETGEQFRITGVGGHFGGSLDSKATFPERYNLIQKMALGEFKTSGTGAVFAKLKKDGMVKAKPVHYAQMCSYGRKYGYEWGLYMCINKNDDDLYVEIVKLDPNYGLEMEKRAYDVITSQVPPVRCSMTRTYHVCKFCTFKAICWDKQPAVQSCRSCVFAKPMEDKKWACAKYGEIPTEFIIKGCGDWQDITK